MFEMSSDQIIDFWDFWKKITHKSHISCAELLCSSHAKDTNQETSHKMAFVAFCSVTWSARTCYSFSCYLNIHSSENKWDMIAHRVHVFSMFYRTEWVTPVPDFREDLEHQYRIFSLPTFRHPLEANSPLPKRSLRPLKPRIWQPRRQPRPILTQIVLYIIFKLLKYEFV